MTARGVAAILLPVGLLLVAAFVWPTRYRHLPRGPQTGGHAVRVDRFSGERFVRVESGAWISLDSKPSVEPGTGPRARPDLPAVPSSPGELQQKGNEIRAMHEAARKAVEENDPLGQPKKPR